MWSDNETDLDLLGFDFLVDEMVVALTQPRLLPLTMGVTGGWGSGKSSLLKIVAAELAGLPEGESGHFVVVSFSPWQYEGYEDIKAALTEAVLARLQQEVEADGPQAEQVGRLRRMATSLRRPVQMLVGTALPAGAAIAAGALDPALADTASMLAQGMVGSMESSQGSAGDGPDAEPQPVAAGAFRQQFAELMESLHKVRAVIVMIDDLDRCLPHTVVDTFEAIRLFLNVDKSAFVIAAHAEVVQAAIDQRYPGLRRSGTSGLGAEYLEKMLQVEINIPALSAPEAETYMHLLLSELYLSQDQFTVVKAAVDQRRRGSALGVALNVGMAADTLGPEMPPELYQDMMWAAAVAPVLGSGLRGNPRQIKRFLNTLKLRLASAERRGTTLDAAILAKLMVLETQYLSDFQRLFDWQSAGPMSGGENWLVTAEQRSRGTWVDDADPARNEAPPASGARRAGQGQARRPSSPEIARAGTLDEEVRTWAEQHHIDAWLRMEPALGGRDLGPYFTFARAKLTLSANTALLSAHIQELLGRLQSDVASRRRAAVRQAAESVDAADLPTLVDHLLQAVMRDPAGSATDGVAELCERIPAVAPAVCERLKVIPFEILQPKITTLVRRLPESDPNVSALLDGWQANPSGGFVRAARQRGRH
ncbi:MULTISPECIES: KAP family P-loop NTPase fold protein [unclassified Streptomyces]|uniref:KAP family P-loop NTPase fold protein n=1 Tax=unclassified Streptomyces TaxID=2593676 RepID=UPI000DAC0855|nr:MULTISPECIES: P-loop NTPase fold protein [unclassified Streptomyces]PZT73872.1 NTPase KAP [Streptomyces sp. AC1-42T]PZT83135.1 NTPase KAP [Streptomyces sp. AC1-42W]